MHRKKTVGSFPYFAQERRKNIFSKKEKFKRINIFLLFLLFFFLNTKEFLFKNYKKRTCIWFWKDCIIILGSFLAFSLQVHERVNTGHMTLTKAVLLLLCEFEVPVLRINAGQGCIHLSCEKREEEGRRTTLHHWWLDWPILVCHIVVTDCEKWSPMLCTMATWLATPTLITLTIPMETKRSTWLKWKVTWARRGLTSSGKWIMITTTWRSNWNGDVAVASVVRVRSSRTVADVTTVCVGTSWNRRVSIVNVSTWGASRGAWVQKRMFLCLLSICSQDLALPRRQTLVCAQV